MPHEKINYPHDDNDAATQPQQLVVGWNEIGWAQVSIYPEGWANTGEAVHVGVSKPELDKLIRTLKRARRQAYGGVARHTGFEDRAPMPEGSSLFGQ